MMSLFPTFTTWLKRAKRFLSADASDVWQRARELIDADEQRYYEQLKEKGLDWLY